MDFFHAHNVRYESVVERRIAAIHAERPLTSDAAVIGPARLLVQALLPQLRAVCQAVARFDDEIERLCGRLKDYKLFPTAEALQRYAGVAPVTERSGNKSWVHWRWSCPKFLRQTFVEWVGETIPRSF
ncbi:Mobile element protein [Minicystis rosea]|nr:Mobile element protein [Minicystis rosea]